MEIRLLVLQLSSRTSQSDASCYKVNSKKNGELNSGRALQMSYCEMLAGYSTSAGCTDSDALQCYSPCMLGICPRLARTPVHHMCKHRESQIPTSIEVCETRALRLVACPMISGATRPSVTSRPRTLIANATAARLSHSNSNRVRKYRQNTLWRKLPRILWQSAVSVSPFACFIKYSVSAEAYFVNKNKNAIMNHIARVCLKKPLSIGLSKFQSLQK